MRRRVDLMTADLFMPFTHLKPHLFDMLIGEIFNICRNIFSVEATNDRGFKELFRCVIHMITPNTLLFHKYLQRFLNQVLQLRFETNSDNALCNLTIFK